MTAPPQLEVVAAGLAAAFPASVELPAGAGKTHLLAEIARQIVGAGGRVLVLTHTNAGVQAIQARLKKFEVTSDIRVATLTSFALLLARAYPVIGQFKVPAVPNWPDSPAYVTAAERIARSRHIQGVLTQSFTHLLVDEYQDCSRDQHTFVSALAESIPHAGVLGDPLQAIFGFKGTPLVPWTDVVKTFPAHPIATYPWRWTGHNEALGGWLLELRDRLRPNEPLSFANATLPAGVSFQSSIGRPQIIRDTALRTWPAGESVLIIAPPEKHRTRPMAANLKGVYSVMEEVAGEFMSKQLTTLKNLEPGLYGSWLLQLTKDCACGHGKLDRPVKSAVDAGRPLTKLMKSRPDLKEVLLALDTLRSNPTYSAVAEAMTAIRKGIRLHSHEAWSDIQGAVRAAAAVGDNPDVLVTELARLRDRVRHQGRRDRDRIVGRTLLVKGLEFDHVVIADIDSITDINNLYVALTRARKTVTIIGTNPTVALKET